MKKLFFLFFFLTVLVQNILAQEGWSVGAEVSPNLFWLYNPKDRDPAAFYQSKDPRFTEPNGIHTGLNVKYTIHPRLEAGAGLWYAYGKQKYFQKYNPTLVTPSGPGYRTDDYHIALEHLKLPLSITGFLFEEGHSPYLQIGLTPTYLIGLAQQKKQTFTYPNGEVYAYYLTLQTLTNLTVINHYDYKPEDRAVYNDEQYHYHRFGLEALLGLGFRFKVSDNIDIRVQSTNQVSLIDPETKRSYFWDTPEGRGTTLLINSGLSISTNYIF